MHWKTHHRQTHIYYIQHILPKSETGFSKLTFEPSVHIEVYYIDTQTASNCTHKHKTQFVMELCRDTI